MCLKGKGPQERTWSMCECVHVCVRKRTFHVCVFQEKRITRITLVYQVDVCVDGCVRKRTKGIGPGLCVCVFMCACFRTRTIHVCMFKEKRTTRITLHCNVSGLLAVC